MSRALGLGLALVELVARALRNEAGPAPEVGSLLLEDSGTFLLEDGGVLKLET